MVMPATNPWARWKRSGVNRIVAIWHVLPLSLFLGMFALAAVACLSLGFTDLGPAIDAAHGTGTVGTFHVTSRLCKNSHNCTLRGNFASDNGLIKRMDVRWLDGATAKVNVGDDLRALDAGDRAGVFRPTGSHEWILILSLILFGGLLAVGLLCWVSVQLVLWLRRRRPVPGDREPWQPRHAA